MLYFSQKGLAGGTGFSTKTAVYEFLCAYLNCAEKSSVVSSSSQLSSQRRPLVVPAVAAAPAVLSAVVAASVSSAGQSVFGEKEVDGLAYMFSCSVTLMLMFERGENVWIDAGMPWSLLVGCLFLRL